VRARAAQGRHRSTAAADRGAYIALWTAIVIVSINQLPVLWLIPTALGTPLIEWPHRAPGSA